MLDSGDLYEIQSVVSATQHPLSVELPGRPRPLRFRIHHHPLSRLALTHAAFLYEGRLRVWAPPFPSHYLIQIPLRGGSRVVHGAREVTTVEARRGVVLSPDHTTTFSSDGGFEEITLEVDAAAVSRAWTTLTGDVLDDALVFEPALRLDAEPGASLLRLVRFLMDEVSRPSSALASGLVLDRLEEALILCLLESQPHTRTEQVERHSRSRSASFVRQAESWMEEHAGERITVAAAAEALGISVRTLQRTFAHHGCGTPMAFLRRVRLERARARLRRGGPHTTVTQVAVGLGFAHLGRFSCDYRARYSESPSSTLDRARRRCPATRVGIAKRIDSAPRLGFDFSHRLEIGTCGLCTEETPPV